MFLTTCNGNDKTTGRSFVLLLMILTLIILLAGLAESAHAKIRRSSRFRVLNKIRTQSNHKQVYPLLAMHAKRGRVLTNENVRVLSKIIVRESAKYGLDPVFIMALMYTESSFRPNVISIADARGLMQVLPSTAEDIAEELGMKITEEELFYPGVNVKLGVWYINSLLQQFNDPLVAITAYNYGPGYARRTMRRSKRFPTKSYVRKIANTYARYLNQISRFDNELVAYDDDISRNSFLEASTNMDYIITM